MRIHTTFVNFKDAPDVVELVHAWDEYALDENPTGFDETREKAVASYGDDVLNVAYVDIIVRGKTIRDALIPEVEVEGAVEVVEVTPK